MRKKAYLVGEFSRFALVGIAATLVHLTIVWSVIRAGLAPPFLANLIAFLIAFVVSFSGHYYWTFKTRLPRHHAAARFFLIAVTGFAFNSFVLILIVRQDWMAPEWAAVISTLFVPAITFGC